METAIETAIEAETSAHHEPASASASAPLQGRLAHGLVVWNGIPMAVSIPWALLVFDAVAFAVAAAERLGREADEARAAQPDEDMTREDLDAEADTYLQSAARIQHWLTSDRAGVCTASLDLAQRTNIRPLRIETRADFMDYFAQLRSLLRPAGSDSYCEFVLLTDSPVPQMLTTRRPLAEFCGPFVEGQMVPDVVLQERMTMHVSVGASELEERLGRGLFGEVRS